MLLELRFLGGLAIQQNGVPLTALKSQKGQALLCYLALTSKAHGRLALAGLLWPEMTEENALMNLRNVLTRLKQHLAPHLAITRQSIGFNQDVSYWLDVAEFEAGVAARSDTGRLQAAVKLYGGDFLEGFYLSDVTHFDEWVLAQRARLRELALSALHRLVTHFTAQAEYETAIAYARQLLAIEPWREEAQRELMRLLALSGQRSAALRQYETLRRILAEEVAVEPSAETETLYQAIRAGQLDKAVSGVVEQGSRTDSQTRIPPPPHNLPLQPTSFIGREAELAALDEWMDDQSTRLVTIVGPGGIGKTRLALACGERHLTAGTRFPNGIFFVNLAPLNEADQIIPTLAGVLDFQLQSRQDGRSPHQQLLYYLRTKRLLLLLDNFDHLLDGAELVVDILQAAPEVRILVTSRERLHLRTEQVYPVEGLEFPDWESLEDAAGYTAVQLFLQSARRNQPDFALRDGADLTNLSRICCLVAGMPLALELAASWVDMLPLAEIATELQKGLNFLETDMQDIPERHRSIRAAIDYSWQKLDEKEQDIFAKLSVFRGGFTREAAKAVAEANLRQLARLVNKSLLQRGREDGRYQLHELLRQYGAEKLAEDREWETAVRQQHSHFYCAALQQWEAVLKSPRQRTAVVEVEADYQNILIAWDEALRRGNLVQLVQAISGLGEFHDTAERWFEGVAMLQASAEKVQADYGDPPTIAGATQLLVWLQAWQVNMYINAPDYYDPPSWLLYNLQSGDALLAQPILADVDTRSEQAFVHLLWGRILQRSNFEKGKEHLAVSLLLYQALGDNLGVAAVLQVQSSYARDEDKLEQAQRLAQVSLRLSQQIGEPRRIANALFVLGDAARSLLAFEESAGLFEKAYATAEAATYRKGMIEASNGSAWQACYLGQFDLALTFFEEQLVWARQGHTPLFEVNCLVKIALIQIFRGYFVEALARIDESMHIKPDYVSEWAIHYLPFAHLHVGQYEIAESTIRTNNLDRLGRYLAWIKLIQANYAEALSLAQQKYAQHPLGKLEQRTRAQVPLAFALHKLGRVQEARQTLYQCLQTCVASRAFLPLMELMPIIPVVLSDGADDKLKERAVEIYAMVESLPFAGNSQLYADLTGKKMTIVTTTLPVSVVEAAQACGRELDWWPTAEQLLQELTELGWAEQVD